MRSRARRLDQYASIERGQQCLAPQKKQAYTDILNVIHELQSNFQVTTVTTQTIEQALLLGERYRYSYFDSLMLASALEQGCTVLYSEDMQHGQIIEGLLRIVDPFDGLAD